MARLSKALSLAEKNTEMRLPPSPWLGPDLSAINTSSAEGDPVLQKEYYELNKGLKDPTSCKGLVIVVRLTEWLASRVGCQPEDIFPEIAELFLQMEITVTEDEEQRFADKRVSMITQLVGARKDTCTPLSSENLDTEQSPFSELNPRISHRRVFSFQPGDDHANCSFANGTVKHGLEKNQMVRPT